MKLSNVIALSSILASANAASFYGTFYGLSDYVQSLLVGDSNTDAEKRLLEFGPGDQDWYNEEEMLQLKRDGRRFIDVTDHLDFYSEQVSIQDASSVEFPEKASYEKQVKKLAENLRKDNLINTLTNFSSFHTRYAKSDYGLESSLWLFDQVLSVASSSEVEVTVKLFDHDWKQKSLIASIPGSKNPDDIVIVGAHQDSINLLFPNVLAAPGADDDGSGTVTTLEVFRALIEGGFKPENTVEFHWYSAEELGLWGSQDVFTKYADDKKDVKAMFQQDMTGYSAKSWEDDGHDSLGVITDYVDPALTLFIKLLVDTYCDIPYAETTCGYACSDHASAAKVGYPSAFVFESAFEKHSPYIHSTKDTVDKLDFDHMLQHAKLTLGYAYELGFATL